ncbi:MAG: DNA adenine methylase [Lentilitoribacter sp.]
MVVSPLRYPGGKAKLFPFFAELIRNNNLFGARYCEPYAGGAGLAIKLLNSGFVESISINDIDKSIVAFWNSILRDTDSFCQLIEATPVDIEQWHLQRAIWQAGDHTDPLTLGFSAFFLNRTNRSGIIEGAGPIGGYEQKGKWKLEVRFSKEKQISNIRSLALYADQISVSNIDALKYLKKTVKKPNTLVYLDPPYFRKGHKLYKNFYTASDHSKIASELSRQINARWVVSYDDVPEIHSIYSEYSPISYLLNYSAGDKSLGAEVMFLSDGLVAPSVPGFSLDQTLARGQSERMRIAAY